MKYTHIKPTVMNENGNILLVCVLIIMMLTSLAIFGMNSTSIEMMTSGAEMREKNNFFNAESGMKFAISYFSLIYGNNSNTSLNPLPIYAANGAGVGMGGDVSLIGGNLDIANLPVGDTGISLRNLPIDTGGVVFDYYTPDPDPRNTDPNNIPIARIEIKAVMVNAPTIATLSTQANNVPSRFHIGPAPEGYSNTLFAARNYCITSTALNRDATPTNTVVQCGIVIAALRNSIVQLQGL